MTSKAMLFQAPEGLTHFILRVPASENQKNADVGSWRRTPKIIKKAPKVENPRQPAVHRYVYIYIYTRVDPCIKCTRSKLDTGQGVLGLVAPEDLLSVCCLVLPLVLSSVVLSPLVSSCLGFSALVSSCVVCWASPGPFLGLCWASGGPF